MILAIVLCLLAHGRLGPGAPTYDAVEFFSGQGAYTNALTEQGFSCAAYELLDDSVRCDILSAEGFVHAVELVLWAHAGALLHFATVCASWVAGIG